MHLRWGGAAAGTLGRGGGGAGFDGDPVRIPAARLNSRICQVQQKKIETSPDSANRVYRGRPVDTSDGEIVARANHRGNRQAPPCIAAGSGCQVHVRSSVDSVAGEDDGQQDRGGGVTCGAQAARIGSISVLIRGEPDDIDDGQVDELDGSLPMGQALVDRPIREGPLREAVIGAIQTAAGDPGVRLRRVVAKPLLAPLP
jgi:hypothetical protein